MHVVFLSICKFRLGYINGVILYVVSCDRILIKRNYRNNLDSFIVSERKFVVEIPRKHLVKSEVY